MSWGLIPFIILDVIAGIAAGLLISYYILKRQNKSFPVFHIFRKKSGETETEESSEEAGDGPDAEAGKTPRQNVPVSPVVEPPPVPDIAALVVEMESNLDIASRPAGGKLVKFQTEVWDASQSGLKSTEVTFLNELWDTYVDMQLANNIVWLVADLGHDSPDFRASYSELKNRIVLRLKRVLPKLKTS